MILWRHLVLIGSISCLSFACSDDDKGTDDGHDDEEPSAEIADVVFVNEISDEALEQLLQKAPVDDASQHIEIWNPTEDEVLDKADLATFEWHPGTAALKLPSASPRSASPWHHVASELMSFFSPIGIAHAHGPTYNGTAYFLVFSTSTNDKLLRVFTGGTSYTPDPESWNTLAEAATPIELHITSGVFEKSLLAADGGPFVAGSVKFTIE